MIGGVDRVDLDDITLSTGSDDEQDARGNAPTWLLRSNEDASTKRIWKRADRPPLCLPPPSRPPGAPTPYTLTTMSDNEGHSEGIPGDDDLSLPKATVAKMITGTRPWR